MTLFRIPLSVFLGLCSLMYSLSGYCTPAVVISIQPLHSLVAGVTAGVIQPQLLIPAAQSPHGFHLRPSDAKMLSRADLVVWVGASLETPLARSINNLSTQAGVISALELDGMDLLATREGGLHRHHPKDKELHNDQHEAYDPHLWLNPINAIILVKAVVARLQLLDPDNAERYQANAEAVIARLQALDRELAQSLEPIRGQPFLVLHDAFQYLEQRYRLNSIGAVSVSPDRRPGARRLAALRRSLRDSHALCLFSEPQVSTKTVRQLVSGSDARLGSLDPIGATITPGPDAYFSMQRGNAQALLKCLTH